jgi:hypothetical protein
MKKHEEGHEKNNVVLMCVVNYTAFIFFLYSSVSIIWCLYLYFFDKEQFYTKHLLGHLYGFFVSNLILLYSNRES